MGQKVNPVGFRVGHFRGWQSRWFADDSSFKEFLVEDIRIRKTLMNKLRMAGIVSVQIDRLPKSMSITLTVSRPGVVIGKGGSGIEEVKKEVVKAINVDRKEKVKNMKIDLQVQEVKNPETSAQLVASRIAQDLERRMPHRRVATKAMERVMQSGAKGVKIVLSGRINGAEIARTEKFQTGPVPTQTMRENIDYAQVPALQKRGYVGVKVWVTKKEEE